MDGLTKNMFLTGAIGVGKSTAIMRAICCLETVGKQQGRSGGTDDWDLSVLQNKSIGGFRTFSIPSQCRGETRRMYIERIGEKTPRDGNHLIGIRCQGGMGQSFPKVFEKAGVDILDNLPVNPTLVIMDEIGIIEDGAFGFQKRVLEILKGEIPVLGVLKQKNGVLTDAVRQQANTAIITVTEQNREEIPHLILSWLKKHEII